LIDNYDLALENEVDWIFKAFRRFKENHNRSCEEDFEIGRNEIICLNLKG